MVGLLPGSDEKGGSIAVLFYQQSAPKKYTQIDFLWSGCFKQNNRAYIKKTRWQQDGRGNEIE